MLLRQPAKLLRLHFSEEDRYDGAPLYEALHGMQKGLKDLLQPQRMFEDLGLKYVGPIDGHDVGAVEDALQRASDVFTSSSVISYDGDSRSALRCWARPPTVGA